MRVLRTVSELAQLPAGCVLSIGNFDGVHLGHRQIIRRALAIASQAGVPLAVMTFEPHPVAILYPEKAPGVLTPLTLKTYLLQTCGVDYLVVLKDTASLLRLSPADFVDKFLLKDIRPVALVEGDDFNFGANRAGNIDTLRQMVKPNSFEVVVVKEKLVRLSAGQSVRVSSTAIRSLLQSSRVSDATILLARHYRLVGQLVSGKGRGRQLGFPTLNMQPSSQIIPQQGVYAGFVFLGQTEDDICKSTVRRPAVFSIGHASTFGDISASAMLIEAHLLDVTTENPSAPWLAMDFVDYIRPQQKFKSSQDLTSQIAKDCLSARNILHTANTEDTK